MKAEDVRKVSVYDFDGTLIDTAMPVAGRKIWKEKTGTDYPHVGWWGRKESLRLDVFENAPFEDIVNEYNKSIKEPNTYNSVCTGRMVKLSNEVQAILDKYGFKFDEVVLNGDKRYRKGAGDTMSFKIRYLADLIKRFPNLEEIEFWDDRTEHMPTFKQWGRQQKIKVTIQHVHQENANRFK